MNDQIEKDILNQIGEAFGVRLLGTALVVHCLIRHFRNN